MSGMSAGTVRDLDARGHLTLERVQLSGVRPGRRRVADPLVGEVRHLVLGVEAVGRVELHLEPLPLRGHPAGVDSLVLGMGPVVLGVVHLMAAAFEPFLDVVVAPCVVLRLKAVRIANSVRDPAVALAGAASWLLLGRRLLGDLLFEAVLALDPVVEALQPAAVRVLILLLDGLRVCGESRLGLANPADRLGRFRLLLRAWPRAVVLVVCCRHVRRMSPRLRPASLVVCPHVREARQLVPVASLPGPVDLLAVLRFSSRV